MSSLRVQDDDHPEAAGKHLADAQALLAVRRFDGCGYLSGYVVECSLKAVILHDNSWLGGAPPSRDAVKLQDWHKKLASRSYGHDLVKLAHAVVGSAGASYMPDLSSISKPSVLSWKETMRYKSPGAVTEPEANAWHEWARHVFLETVSRMHLDGVL
jgi:hypothetical protein